MTFSKTGTWPSSLVTAWLSPPVQFSLKIYTATYSKLTLQSAPLNISCSYETMFFNNQNMST